MNAPTVLFVSLLVSSLFFLLLSLSPFKSAIGLLRFEEECRIVLRIFSGSCKRSRVRLRLFCVALFICEMDEDGEEKQLLFSWFRQPEFCMSSWLDVKVLFLGLLLSQKSSSWSAKKALLSCCVGGLFTEVCFCSGCRQRCEFWRGELKGESSLAWFA